MLDDAVFDDRLLVGMTQGARKRAARHLANVWQHQRNGWTRARWLAYYAEARAVYRIGQRLRPCLGCPHCTDWAEELDSRCTDGEKVWYLHDPDSSHPCDWACGEYMRGVYCDGTGVLPARRA